MYIFKANSQAGNTWICVMTTQNSQSCSLGSFVISCQKQLPMYSCYNLTESKKYTYLKISGRIATMWTVNCYHVTESVSDLGIADANLGDYANYAV